MSTDIVVLWANKGNLLPYKKEEYAGLVFKFLYWHRGKNGRPVLVAGNYPDVELHSDIAKIAWGTGGSKQVVAVGQAPIAAGTCYFSSGIVRDWGSKGFGVETPQELRPMILEALDLRERD